MADIEDLLKNRYTVLYQEVKKLDFILPSRIDAFNLLSIVLKNNAQGLTNTPDELLVIFYNKIKDTLNSNNGPISIDTLTENIRLYIMLIAYLTLVSVVNKIKVTSRGGGEGGGGGGDVDAWSGSSWFDPCHR